MAYKKPRKPIWDADSGVPPTDEQVEKMKKQAYNIAWYWLGQQNMHSNDLYSKWDRRSLPRDITDPIMEDLRKQGMMDDDRTLRLFIDSELRSRVGAQAIRYKLIKKGIPSDEIQMLLDELIDEEQAEENIQYLAEKKARQVIRLEERKRIPNIVGHLSRRGYSAGASFSAAREALDKVLAEQEPEDDEEY